jgi:hypothetical protein
MLGRMQRKMAGWVLAVVVAQGGCAFDDGLLGGVRVTCEDDDDCVAGTACAADGLCRDPEANVPPEIALGAIARTAGPIAIPVTLFDVESDPAVVDFEVRSGDGPWQRITVAHDPLSTRPEGATTELSWQPLPAVLSATVFSERVMLRATPRSVDGERQGAASESTTFGYGNTAPVLYDIVLPEIVSGPRVPIVLTVADDEGDDIRIASAEFVLGRSNSAVGGSDPQDPKLTPDVAFESQQQNSSGGSPPDDGPPTVIDVRAGVEQAVGLVWNTTQDPPATSAVRASLKITLVDDLGAVSAPMWSRPFLYQPDDAP